MYDVELNLTEPRMSPPSEIKSIFLAEDDEDDVVIFSEILLDITKEITLKVAANGIELMSLLKKSMELPEVIFLDINMPLKNGFQCLQEIKGNAKWKGIRTIVYSTSAHPQQIEKAYQDGADLFLQKSTSYVDFKQSLQKCLSNSDFPWR
jgi:CheY-like chemotaxis protein